jgi:hypothetical protein
MVRLPSLRPGRALWGRLMTVAALLLSCCEVFAQKQSETRDQVWLGYFNQTRLSDRSGIWVDLQFRTNEFMERASSDIARVGYTYYVFDHMRLTAGYGRITHFALHDPAPDIPEHRTWQQVQWFDRNPRTSLVQYLRVEQRFLRRTEGDRLIDDYRFSWRFRYNFGLSIPLKGSEIVSGTPFLFLNDEIHINAGKEIVNNYFDQNRLFAGIGYQVTSNINAHLGYLYVFQQLPAGNQYVNTHAVRLFLFHNLDLRGN